MYSLTVTCLIVCFVVNNCYSASLSSKDDKIDLSHFNNAAFALPSENTGKLVNNWSEKSEGNPEELGEYVEGDILFPNFAGKNGLKAESSRWPKGIVPFVIDGNFNAFEMQTIEDAINIYKNETCIKFVPRSKSDADYIRITGKNTGCWSSVGRIGGEQQLNLQPPGCLKRIGTVVHELMHAVGFLHEQNRPERDQYVDVVFRNIKSGHEHNFDRAKKTTVRDFGVAYDYGSVMHYSSKAFSKNGQKTIIPKKSDVEIGQRSGFSKGDILKINNMYNCKN